jgi:hypothetical protein
VIHRIRDALGWLTGWVLVLLIIGALASLPIVAMLWIAVALGIRDAAMILAHIELRMEAIFAAADRLMPGWAWFGMIALCWLAFIDVHVRGVVRDELAKYLKDKE